MKNKKYLIMIIGICLFLVSCFLFLVLADRNNSVNNFINAYSNYRMVAEKNEVATHLPAMSDNTVRQELDQILAGLLTENMGLSERLEMSERGIKLAKKLEEQIDDIGRTVSLVETAILQLEESKEGIHGNKAKEKADEMIDTAKEKVALSSDIRGLSYRANYYTVEIFKRVIADGGQLTSSHILYLNRQIPEAEKQFDKRADLYTHFESLSSRIRGQYNDFEDSL